MGPWPRRTATHMRPLSLLALLAVGSSPAFAATVGSGVKLTESRKIPDFTELEVSGGVTLDVKRGPTSLTIEGDDNIVPLYSTEVTGSRLRIRLKSNEKVVRAHQKLMVRVTTPALERLSASGGVEASVRGVAAPKFAVDASGGVELSLPDLEVDSLAVEASGGVKVVASGRARAAAVDLSGGVDLKAKGLEVAQLSVKASGGCDAEISATESIAGDISGGVGLTVHGNPPKSRVRTSGGSSVEYAK